MILDFTIKNFRSIRGEMKIILEAESGQTKSENTFEVTVPNDKKRKLLHSAVVYGANASGKTNVIRALYNLINYVKHSNDLSIDQHIPYYEPFLFDTEMETAPTVFTFNFLVKEGKIYIQYNYQLSFNREEIIHEELNYYPKGQSHNLFTRTNETDSKSGTIHVGKLSKSLGYKEYDVFKNQLLLSKFGREIPNETLAAVYLYFTTVEVWNALDVIRIGNLKAEIATELFLSENSKLLHRINKLIRIADTKINSIRIQESDKSQDKNFEERMRGGVIRKSRQRDNVLAMHTMYSNGEKSGTRALSLSEESAGTNVLFALGGIILRKLQDGGVLFFDELDNSLHPKLTKFLIRLFNNPISNPKNAQLIVATHEVTLLDKEVFRKDQIWFTEKNEQGVTELFSAKDFEGVRDDTPFDKWYMNGKFGGQPNIKEIEFIFSHGEEKA